VCVCVCAWVCMCMCVYVCVCVCACACACVSVRHTCVNVDKCKYCDKNCFCSKMCNVVFLAMKTFIHSIVFFLFLYLHYAVFRTLYNVNFVCICLHVEFKNYCVRRFIFVFAFRCNFFVWKRVTKNLFSLAQMFKKVLLQKFKVCVCVSVCVRVCV
jgi:hypothetical protein